MSCKRKLPDGLTAAYFKEGSVNAFFNVVLCECGLAGHGYDFRRPGSVYVIRIYLFVLNI